jgi:hypothetical protein
VVQEVQEVLEEEDQVLHLEEEQHQDLEIVVEVEVEEA